MTQVNFENCEQIKDWLIENLIQWDNRYIAEKEETNIIINLIYNKAILIENEEIPFIKEPFDEDLGKIPKPQTIHKYIALQLLKLNSIEKIKFEYSFFSRKPDVYGENNDKVILVECCSCYVDKIIGYLEKPNTELWVITNGFAPWDIMFPHKYQSSWYIIKRGPNWDKYLQLYKKHLVSNFQKIKNPLDCF